jgi:broad specificity phosphatase PhoE
MWLIRHGETEWSVSGAHTGVTEIALTDQGRRQAAAIGRQLEGRHFGRVLTSPRERAKETCRLAGFGNVAEIEDGIQEWNYGSYEGKTTSEIKQARPEWSVWRDSAPDGETIDQVATRAKKIIVACERGSGPVLLFSHAHFLRVLAACWLGLPAETGRLFAMDVASLSILGYERENRVIRLWNDPASPLSHRRMRALGSNGAKSQETKIGR